jgi:hypothetical protein
LANLTNSRRGKTGFYRKSEKITSFPYTGISLAISGEIENKLGGAPAGIDELAGCCAAAGFSWQAHL